MKCQGLSLVDSPEGLFYEWYANLFTCKRTQYILTTNAHSLLSFAMYGRGISDDDLYLKRMLFSIGEYMRDIDCKFIFERVIVPQTGRITLSKTLSKAVLGSMNDMMANAKYLLETEEISPYDLAFRLNDIPMKYINYMTPIEAFKKMSIDL